MIQVKNITFGYAKHTVLDNVSLDIKDNMVTALIGANGAGKSTLLGIASRLITPASGTVLIDNVDIKEQKSTDIAKKLAVLKQSHSLNIRISINDLVEFGRFPHCGGRLQDIDKEEVAKAIDYMNLTDIKDKFVTEISGGQRQRAFIAMILAQNTPYILLDEPLYNLDIKYSVEMMKLLRQLVVDLNKTVVVVVHDINFASAYSDHVVAMKDGKIVAQGAPKEIITKGVLDDVFDHDFNIIDVENKQVNLYF